MTASPVRYRAEWVLPVTAPPIRHGVVVVDPSGVITAVGRDDEVPAVDSGATVDLGRAALLPGLVNTHAHPELTLLRGMLEDTPFHDWIPALMRAKRVAAVEAPIDFDCAARWTCAEALAAGITTMAATEDSGAALGALRDAGLRGIVYREVFGPDPSQAEQSLAQLRDKVEAMRAAETDLVRAGVSPHAPYSVSGRLFRLTAEYALAERLPIAVHAAEAIAELVLVARGEGPFADGLRARGIATPPRRARSTIALLEQTRVLEARPLLIHCVHIDDEDVRLIAASGAAVAHCPVANGRLGHGVAPLPELLAAGVPVGLGTDSVASNNRLDLFDEARVGQILHRCRMRSATVLPAAQLLRLATIEGARALGLEHRIGSLEPGKEADLCAIGLDRPHVLPVHDPVAAVFHAARATDVIFTAVRGRPLYRDGRLATLDLDELRPRLEHEAARIAAASAR